MTLPTSPAATRPAVVDGVDLDAVAAAVRGCPGVDDLDAGPLMTAVTTYLPGRKLDGLKVTADTLTVQVRSVWGVPVTQVGEQIRIAVAHLTVGREVDIVVSDLTPPPGYEPAPEPVEAEWLDSPAPTSPPVDTTEPPVGTIEPPPSTDPSPAQPPLGTVVERTVTIAEKVVSDDDSTPLGTAPLTAPVVTGPTAGPVPTEPETLWVTSTPPAGGAGEPSSGPTTPTPAEIPPRS